MRRRGFFLASAALCLGALPALAQHGTRGARMPRAGRVERGQNPKKTPIEEFETLPPAEQQKALNRLPPDQRHRLEERLQRFNALPPEQQQALKTLYNRLHELPPQRQEGVRKSINKFAEQAPERQQAMRDELRRLAALPQQERQAHMNTAEFRGRFSKKEQEVLRDMSALLPER